MDVNLMTPINQFGYGIVGLNVLRELTQQGHHPALWVLRQLEAPAAAHELISQALQRAGVFNPMAPSLKIWHPFEMAVHVGKGLHAGLPTFELNRFTPAEKHHLSSLDLVFIPSHWGKEILKANGIPAERIHVVWHGVDTSIFHPGLCTPSDSALPAPSESACRPVPGMPQQSFLPSASGNFGRVRMCWSKLSAGHLVRVTTCV